jgi:integrase
MAEEDIYGNKRKYERFFKRLDSLAAPLSGTDRVGQRLYYCKNPANLKYFRLIDRHFASRDASYIRRNRVLDHLLFLTWATEKDLSACERADIDELVAQGHRVNTAVDSKLCFIRNVKWLWRILFPERDEHGRVDERIVPYPVRHLACRVDKSRQRLRGDKMTLEEVDRLVTYFASDPRLQAYITLILESLGRPQEVSFTRIRDVELHENYGRVWVSSHGKEGVKFLLSIDSYPYLSRWFSQHPFQGDPEAFLFLANQQKSRPLTPVTVNKRIRIACDHLGLKKRITAYSLKRNGVTFCRLRGDSDVEIQHRAGWTSTRQLRTYDLSTPEEAFHNQLIKRGLIKGEKNEKPLQSSRLCVCGSVLGFADKVCQACKRRADRQGAQADIRAEQEIRQVLLMALDEPDRSLADLLADFRKQGPRSKDILGAENIRRRRPESA